MRGRIISLLKEHPYNANRIANKLDIDYKTAQHHLRFLSNNSLITSQDGNSYGTVYFISDSLEENYGAFLRIWKNLGQNQE